jgi:ssRNA-specific RNase YbeY (16S rRNA maturation enzyme)
VTGVTTESRHNSAINKTNMENKYNVILTITKQTSMPQRTRTTTRKVSEIRRVFNHLRDNMREGDVISVPMANDTKVASMRSQLGEYRREEKLTDTLGYKTQVVKENGGLQLYIGRIPIGKMRNAAAPHSKNPAPQSKADEFSLVPVPVLPRLPRLPMPSGPSLPPLPQPSGSGVQA